MSKGLEALNRLLENDYFNLIISSRTSGKRQYANDIYIIEKELEEYQQHEEILNYYSLTLANFREACLLFAQWKSEGLCWADYDKQKKALEIIKKKRVDVSWLFMCFNFIENCSNEDELEFYNYNYEAYRKSKPLTQEEFDLLKEVLLDDYSDNSN